MAKEIQTTCCVVGGGPAGMMAGLLLARAGIEVVVLEKHADFFRDFRGDTVHPSTTELMHELGILNDFLKRPHQQVERLGGVIGNDALTLADFSKLSTRCKFIVLMPQWDFLDFLAEKAKRYPTFSLHMRTEAIGLVEEHGKIVGVRAATADGEDVVVRSDLVIAADGRHSVMRTSARLEVEDYGAPMDVFWMRLSRKSDDPPQTLGRINAGVIFIMLNRGDYWQCGFVIPKGRADEYRSEGIEAFRKRVVAIAPFTADRIDELKSFDDVKLLTVRVDRLKQWYRDGLLCIGDAAHAMSPIGGVGINLAVQDAVAAANLLWKPLEEKRCTVDDLRRVQERRLYPTRMTQRLQVTLQNQVITPTLQSEKTPHVPPPMRLLDKFPALRVVPATIIGVGFRPEHIATPEKRPAAPTAR